MVSLILPGKRPGTTDGVRGSPVLDLVFLLVTLALFGALAMIVRGVGRL